MNQQEFIKAGNLENYKIAFSGGPQRPIEKEKVVEFEKLPSFYKI